MSRKKPFPTDSPDAPHVPREKTVLLDQFNVGETFSYTQSDGNRMGSGEAVSHNKDEQSSYMYKFRSRYSDDDC